MKKTLLPIALASVAVVSEGCGGFTYQPYSTSDANELSQIQPNEFKVDNFTLNNKSNLNKSFDQCFQAHLFRSRVFSILDCFENK
jgi:hypothetical protein